MQGEFRENIWRSCCSREAGLVRLRQVPLYPMPDNLDTKSSADNHGKVWNTRKSHIAWPLYLQRDAKKIVSPHANFDCRNRKMEAFRKRKRKGIWRSNGSIRNFRCVR